MARPLRQAEAGLFYHVMARGNNGNPVFLCKADFQDYLDAFARTMKAFSIEVHSFALMTNHPHMLLRPLKENLSEAMRRLLGWHARRFNWRHGRRGHVFCNRFLSKAVSSLSYLKRVVAYIANNPPKAGLCQRPEDYPYSSFAALLGLRKDPMIERSVVQSLFPGGAEELRAFTAGQLSVASDESGWPVEEGWYRGDLEHAMTAPEAHLEVPSDLVVRIVAESRAVDPAVLRQAVRNPRLGRVKGLAALALRDSTALTLSEIADAVGMASAEGVCKAIAAARRVTSPEEMERIMEAVRNSTSG